MSDAFSIQSDGDNVIIGLVSILDMSVADDFLSQMREGVAGHKNLSLNAQNVERLSTPCVQIMLSAAAEIENKGGRFTVENISKGFERSMRELGLSDHLKNWSAN
jgi:chemotaxis protein CheX